MIHIGQIDKIAAVTFEKSVIQAESVFQRMKRLCRFNCFPCPQIKNDSFVLRFGIFHIVKIQFLIPKSGFQNDIFRFFLTSMTAFSQRFLYFFIGDGLEQIVLCFHLIGIQSEFRGGSQENDFHGIFYLQGGVGLAAYLLYLAYFVGLILWALIKSAKRYFTFEAAGYGIAFLLCMANVYNTAGVLRRPNASVFLSVVLAGIYYLVKIRSYPDCEKQETKR